MGSICGGGPQNGACGGLPSADNPDREEQDTCCFGLSSRRLGVFTKEGVGYILSGMGLGSGGGGILHVLGLNTSEGRTLWRGPWSPGTRVHTCSHCSPHAFLTSSLKQCPHRYGLSEEKSWEHTHHGPGGERHLLWSMVHRGQLPLSSLGLARKLQSG